MPGSLQRSAFVSAGDILLAFESVHAGAVCVTAVPCAMPHFLQWAASMCHDGTCALAECVAWSNGESSVIIGRRGTRHLVGDLE